ncbi:ankyrin repeat domain-containing protein [Legionella sp. km535]|uniref:ankyrin repeat domain-containing protein n=1 Tax=Legionella sp. km535 TaxID=2498107 RepID=UPI000F8DAD01|nr:ankyrin repeat domain-containing protein [Legionella sp. km535]RUR19095.1 ankyrin repeat domain-containing protein [Legionella sp. km535]
MPKLYSPEEHLAHPLARLIPEIVWHGSYFIGSAKDAELQRAQGTLEEASAPLQPREQPLKSLLCMLYGHPDATTEQALHAARAMGCDDQTIFIAAACAGREGLLSTLGQAMDLNVIRHIIMTDDYILYRITAGNGHLPALEYLESLMTDQQMKTALKASDYEAYRHAAAEGYRQILDHLENRMTNPQKEAALEAIYYGAYTCAAMYGRLEILEYLESRMTNPQKEAALKAQDYCAYRGAAENGQLHILEYLEGRMTNPQKEAALEAGDYYAYQWAAANGHLHILEYLEGRMINQQIEKAWQASNFFAYCWAAANGHKHILIHLESLMTNPQKEAALEANGYNAYRQAAAYNLPHILEYLEERMTDSQKEAAQQACNCYGYTYAATRGHQNIVEHLSKTPRVFAYAEMHIHEYGDHVRSFAQTKLQDWQQASEAFAGSNPNGVFNLDEKSSRLAFYIARHLIRENTAASSEQLRFLMGIPGVAFLAHQEVTPNEANELLRLALTCQNRTAADILLSLTRVRTLAEANNYYFHEMQGRFDLRALARDRESSMRALAPAEQQRIRRLDAYYGPVVQSRGTDNLLEVLREFLRERYRDNPAQITVNDTTINLPLNWQDFESLGFEGDLREKALKAYYAHPEHSALRWLLQPNPWMAENAAYVEGTPGAHTAYSTFGNYREMIALFWLAASDGDTPATDGHTLVGRIEHFIRELALIERAHNWDRTRPVQRADGTWTLEEYDDLEGDKPSCFSGVKRRLFQSVIGHPLLQPFGNDILDAELREFARRHFADCITETSKRLLLKAQKSIENLEPLSADQFEAMKSLNIPPDAISAFIDRLQEKYTDEWTPACTEYLQAKLALPYSQATHVNSLWLLTDFSNLLQSIMFASATSPSSASVGFFATGGSGAASSSSAGVAALRDNDTEHRQSTL